MEEENKDTIEKNETVEISEANNPETFDEHTEVAKQGGNIARNARMELEAKTGQAVLSPANDKKILQIKNEHK